jgi:methionyl-tRNA formyltransferase
VWTAPELRAPATVAAIRAVRPDLGVSGWFGYILKPELLQCFSVGCVNLHPAYLPFNGGWHTNVWPILDGSPAGVTLHFIDQGVDTGDIIAQRLVPVRATDTGGSLHQRLTVEMAELFKASWPSLREGRSPRTPQDHSRATHHKKAELAAIDHIDLQRRTTGREWLNLLRARTYPPYPSAYFLEQGQRVYVRVQLREAPDDSPGAQEPVNRIDLDRIYLPLEFIRRLETRADHDAPGVWFEAKGRAIWVSATRHTDAEINPAANPPWMT